MSLNAAIQRPNTSTSRLSIAQSSVPIIDAQPTRREGVGQDALRRKFALYGRQHAHVDHIQTMNHDTKSALQNTMLLQEDGCLSAKLDHVSYLLDGLLKSSNAPQMRLAQTQSLLELLQLMQDPQILSAVALSSLRVRMKQLLLSRLTISTGEETARLSLAVLVYFLSHCADAEDYFNDQVFTAIVHALKQELQGEVDDKKDTMVFETKTSPKKCLKRKNLEEKSRQSCSTSTMEVMDAMCRMNLDKLLQDHEVFYAGEELHVSVISALCAALHKLLQPDAKALSHLTPSYEQSSDTADAYRCVQARKGLLMRTGGLDVLADELYKQMQVLQTQLLSASVDDVTTKCVRLLHHVSLMMNVLGQAACQAVDLKHHMSGQMNMFKMLLNLIDSLSKLSWNVQEKWHATPSRMSLAVEVLLSALRVLINLTHHESQAANYVHTLGGMQILVNAFLRLCGVTSAEQSRTQKKWSFDACLLLLSVIVNNLEFSEENRDALAGASVDQVKLSCRETNLAERSVCALFVDFFLSKVQSYKHLIKGYEAQAVTIEEDNDWNPEDVILGGCTSLILGYLMKGSTTNSAAILKSMPGSSPELLLGALRAYVAFYSQINALTPEVVESILLLETLLKSNGESTSRSDHIDMVEMVAVESEGTSIDVRAVDLARSYMRPSSLRARPLKNVCYRLDDSDDDTEPCIEAVEKVVESHQVIGLLTSASNPLDTMQTPGKSLTQLSSETVSNREKTYGSLPVAIRPDGSMSSPVVARLLKRTRQLVEEFDTKFASGRLNPTEKVRNAIETRGEDSAQSGMVLTMNVTCCNTGNGDLDLLRDMVEPKVEAVGVALNQVGDDLDTRSAKLWKRKKPTRDLETSSTMYQKTSFDFISSGTPPPSTPLRVTEDKGLLETPTRAKRTPGLYRRSPSLILTPTRSSPATPAWTRKSSGLLQTQKGDLFLQKDTPTSVNRYRRKAKTVLLPTSTRATSVFDFTD